MMQPRRLLAALILTLLAPAAAAQAPGFSESERRQGAQVNPQLTAQFGGAYTGPQAAYVRQVGQRIAAQSGLAARASDYTVTLLNSNINNAFAIPGGYVYATRNLVALMNNEAELAFVLGHEVGHVAARHAQKRGTRSAITGIGAAILGAVTGSETLGRIAGTGAQLYTLGYSRDQEREADSLGVRYLARAGYNPSAGASILASLEAQTALDARLAGRQDKTQSQWLSSHPASTDRVARVQREAATLRSATPTATARTVNRDAFLNAIDGMLYDDDPAQGVVQGSSFRHPGLRIAFDAPAGFQLQNNPDSVVGAAQGRGQFKFGGAALAADENLAAFSDRVWRAVAGEQAAGVGNIRRIDVGGVETAISGLRMNSTGGPVDVTLAAYRWDQRQAFTLLTIAPVGGDPGFDTMIRSMRRLAPADAAQIRARRIAVVTVRRGETVASLAARMAYTDDRVARFTVLNGVPANARLVPGDRVKLIVWR